MSKFEVCPFCCEFGLTINGGAYWCVFCLSTGTLLDLYEEYYD